MAKGKLCLVKTTCYFKKHIKNGRCSISFCFLGCLVRDATTLTGCGFQACLMLTKVGLSGQLGRIDPHCYSSMFPAATGNNQSSSVTFLNSLFFL